MVKETKIGIVAQEAGDFNLLVRQSVNHDVWASPSLNPNIITFLDKFGEKTTYIHIRSLDDIIGVFFNDVVLCENIAHESKWIDLYETAKLKIYKNMSQSTDLPPLTNCNNYQNTKFGALRGFVSDVYYENNILSFTFGRHRQVIMIYNYKGEQWLKDGMRVEVDFDQRIITHNRNEQE
jgi:hypothetical protein